MMQAPLCNLPSDQLRTADIVLTKSQTFNSRAIQGSTCSTYSHALLMVSPTLAVEALPSGVDRLNLADLRKDAKEQNGEILVLRHRSISFAQAMKVAAYTQQQVGKPYDPIGAARSAAMTGCKAAKVIPPLLQITLIDELSKLTDTAHDKTFYCSELVARAFEIAGAPLSRYKARNVSPGEILKAEALMIVGQII